MTSAANPGSAARRPAPGTGSSAEACRRRASSHRPGLPPTTPSQSRRSSPPGSASPSFPASPWPTLCRGSRCAHSGRAHPCVTSPPPARDAYHGPAVTAMVDSLRARKPSRHPRRRGLTASRGARHRPAAASARADHRSDLARDQLELSPLIAQGPQVDAVAPGLGVARGAPRSAPRTRRRPSAELVGVSIQQRGKDVVQHPIALGAIAVTQVHIVASAFGKPSASRPRATSARDSIERARRNPPASCYTPMQASRRRPRHPREPGRRAPARDPQRHPAPLDGLRQELDL